MTKPEREAYIAWIRTMRLDWFATPSFRHPVTPRTALEAVTTWLHALPRAYAFVGVQRGPLGDRLHVHALVGGVGRHSLTEALLRGNWRRGNIDLVGYSPLKGAVEYVVHQADEIEVIGRPRSFDRTVGANPRLRVGLR